MALLSYLQIKLFISKVKDIKSNYEINISMSKNNKVKNFSEKPLLVFKYDDNNIIGHNMEQNK